MVKNSKSKIETRGGQGDAPPLDRSQASITLATSEPSEATGEGKGPKGKARGICFTMYQYETFLDKMRQHLKDEATYGVIGFEVCPDTGRKHLQGYVHYESQRSLNKFWKTWNHCHVEAAVGTPLQAAEYCKEDGVYEEYGALPVQGHRTDWEKAVRDLKEKDVIDVILEQPQLAPTQRALREIKSMYLKPLHRDVKVIALWGKGGTGKTRWAFDNYPALYKKPVGEWWDGYTGQKAILLDDYYGYIRYSDFLHVLDIYPLNVPYKGGFIWVQYDVVIITSNKHPKYWYSSQYWDWPLRRRLHKIIEVKCIDGETIYEEEEYPANEEAWRDSQTTYAIT